MLLLGLLIVLSAPVPGRAGDKEMTTAAMSKRVLEFSQLESRGWKTARPPYPYQAMKAHDQGDIYLELTTDATGKVVQAVAPTDDKHPALTQNSAGYIRMFWHGPPSVTQTVILKYRLQ